ncbi:PKHO2 protein, partial [Polypterus senegalus]
MIGSSSTNLLLVINSSKIRHLISDDLSDVPDIKFQAQTAEEKQEWIKAFSESINKAKNKIFDEVAITSSEGTLRLNLDDKTDDISYLQENANCIEPSGPLPNTVAKPPVRPSKEVTLLLVENEDKSKMPPNREGSIQGNNPEDDSKQPKKILKPPMPPLKDNKPCLQVNTEEGEDKPLETEATTVVPPCPPSKALKPLAPPAVEVTPVLPVAEVTTEDLPLEKDKTDIEPSSPASGVLELQPDVILTNNLQAEKEEKACDEPKSKYMPPPCPPSKHLKPYTAPPKEINLSTENTEEDTTDTITNMSESSPTPFRKIVKNENLPSLVHKTNPSIEEAPNDFESLKAPPLSVNEKESTEENLRDTSKNIVTKEPTPQSLPDKSIGTPVSLPQENKPIIAFHDDVFPESGNKIIYNSSPGITGFKRPQPPCKINKLSNKTLTFSNSSAPPSKPESQSIEAVQTISTLPISPKKRIVSSDTIVATKEDGSEPSSSHVKEEVPKENSEYNLGKAVAGLSTALCENQKYPEVEIGCVNDNSLTHSQKCPVTTSAEHKTEVVQNGKQTLAQQKMYSKSEGHFKSGIGRPRCSSLGDLLAESDVKVSSEEQIEIKVQSGKYNYDDLQQQLNLELLETGELLEQISDKRCQLQGTGSGAESLQKTGDASAEKILNEAVEKLKKAQVFLQEVKNLTDTQNSGLASTKESRRRSM